MKKYGRIISFVLSFAIVLGMSFAVFAADESVENIAAGMSTKQKITQMIMPSVRYFADSNGTRKSMTELDGVMKDLIEKYPFAGVILYAMNITSTEQTVRLTDMIQKANAAHGAGQMLIAVDQEGGRVTRLVSGTQFAGNMALGAAGSENYAYETGEIIGKELKALGINTNFAPDVDVNNNPSNPIIGVRSFSDDPQTVALMGKAFMNGLKSTDTIPTLKHFPGHGNTDTDSHTGLPKIDSTYEELKTCELVPFKACIDEGAEMIMTAHIQYPNIETGTYKSILDGRDVYLPATLSKTILADILRKDMGFDGVIVTDAMEMDAISKHFSKIDAFKLAIGAGVDILICPGDIVTADDAAKFEKLLDDLADEAENDAELMTNINAAVYRILTLKKNKNLLEAYDESGLSERIANAKATVGSKEHHDKEWEITKKALTLVKNENKTLPLDRFNEKTVILTAFADEITSMEYAKERIIAENKLPDGCTVEIGCFRTQSGSLLSVPELKELVKDADNVIAVTELVGGQTGLNPANTSNSAAAQSALVDALIPFVHENGGRFIILSCHLPYDAARYPDADAVMLAWSPKGMSENPNYHGDGDLAQYGPAMPAAVYMAFSDDETPTGKLPINIPALDSNYKFTDDVIYERGYGLEYKNSLLLYCCVYYDSANRMISVRKIDRKKAADGAKAEVVANKPQNAAYAKIFRWRTNLRPMADVVYVYLR
ncbi:MAG: glycoside hydrolase family 3 protein [Clostridiales bacterium]|nr:glycoside hydrolase family 3 protein [Clostridiales bacterium]